MEKAFIQAASYRAKGLCTGFHAQPLGIFNQMSNVMVLVIVEGTGCCNFYATAVLHKYAIDAARIDFKCIGCIFSRLIVPAASVLIQHHANPEGTAARSHRCRD